MSEDKGSRAQSVTCAVTLSLTSCVRPVQLKLPALQELAAAQRQRAGAAAAAAVAAGPGAQLRQGVAAAGADDPWVSLLAMHECET